LELTELRPMRFFTKPIAHRSTTAGIAAMAAIVAVLNDR
jgi:hypothetical protein